MGVFKLLVLRLDLTVAAIHLQELDLDVNIDLDTDLDIHQSVAATKIVILNRHTVVWVTDVARISRKYTATVR